MAVIILRSTQQPLSIVRAFGPLNVTFPGIPMFNEINWKPGMLATKTIIIENTDAFVHKIGMKTTIFSDSQNPGLSGALSIVISINGTILYGQGSPVGEKSLRDFYNEPVIWLGDLKGGGKENIDLTVKMDLSRGNEFQGKTTGFDILVGIDNVFTVPPVKPMPTVKIIDRAIPTIKSVPTIKPVPSIRPARSF